MHDDIDRRILRQWQAAPDISRVELSVRAGLSLASLNRRIDRMKDAGIVKGRGAIIDWRAFGMEVVVFLRVSIDKTKERALEHFILAARQIDEISVIETLLGRVDIRMDVRARDLAHYQEIYVTKILALPHIHDIETLMLVSEVKNTKALPI